MYRNIYRNHQHQQASKVSSADENFLEVLIDRSTIYLSSTAFHLEVARLKYTGNSRRTRCLGRGYYANHRQRSLIMGTCKDFIISNSLLLWDAQVSLSSLDDSYDSYDKH